MSKDSILSSIKGILNFGGWLTLSNIISPIMNYMDRFLVGSLLSVTSVAYYTTPYDTLMKLQIFPVSIMSVLFPRVSGLK